MTYSKKVMKRITHTTAKYVLNRVFETGRDAVSIIEEENLWQIDDIPTLSKIIDEVIKANPKAVADYKGRK